MGLPERGFTYKSLRDAALAFFSDVRFANSNSFILRFVSARFNSL